MPKECKPSEIAAELSREKIKKASQQESMIDHGPTSQDLAMMQKAINEAHQAIDAGKVGVAALLLLHAEVVALGHNQYVETGDVTAHGEMVLLRSAARLLNTLTPEEKAHLTIYATLEPCLMCLSAISFAGIKRVVYAALAVDANAEELIARGLTAEKVNPLLTRGPLELVPGVLREQGRELLARMGKLRQ
jgi:tRNA(adenine34) deaminase